MKRLILVGLAFAILASADVRCKTPGGADNGTGGQFIVTAGRGTCASGFTRPVYYVVEATSYNFQSTNSGTRLAGIAQFDLDMQAVFNDAWLGDKVLYTAGQEFIHGVRGGPRITKRRFGTGTLEVTTTEYAKLPPSGTRITPAYAPLMPTIHARVVKSLGTHGDNLFVLPGGPGAAEHVAFRGIRIAQVKTDDDTLSWGLNGGMIVIGPPAGRGQGSELTTVVSGAGTTSVGVLSTDGFAVTTPRQQLAIGNNSAQGLYTVEGVNPSTYVITVSPAYAVTTGTQYVWSILNREGESNLQPDDITIEHCLFANPPPRRFNIGTQLVLGARRATVRDNWMELYDVGNPGLEPKLMQTADGYGPYTIENNYYYGAMSWMAGGQFSYTHAHVNAGATWRYNTFHLPDEYLFTQTWDIAFGPDNSWKSLPDTSVDGLPEHSNRYVSAGRTVLDHPMGSAAKWYWGAYNSGVVGTSRPACFDAHGTTRPSLANSANTYYCYDGDPARASRGTTYCPPQNLTGVTAVPNGGDGACWELKLEQWTIKNAWESKDSSHQLMQYNGFIGYPPQGFDALNTGQFTVVNVKISSAYYGFYFNFIPGTSTRDGTITSINYPNLYPQLVNSTWPNKVENLSGCFFDLTDFPTPTTSVDGYVLPAGYSPWPFCARAHGDDLKFKNNLFKNVVGGFQLIGSYTSGLGGHAMSSGDWEVSGNLFQMKDPIEFGHPQITLNSNPADDQNPLIAPNVSAYNKGPFQVPPTNVTIKNNTFYAPYNQPSTTISTTFGIGTNNTNVDFLHHWNGTRVWDGNIWASLANASFYRGGLSPEEAGFLPVFPGSDDVSGKAYWRKNVVLGAAQGSYQRTTYPAGTAWTGCPTGARCSGTTGLPIPDYSPVLVNAPKSDFRVRSDFAFGKRSLDGGDLGADPDQVPMIRSLTVTPTDRAVAFQYRLTSVIKDIPCVIELHTNPDMESTDWAGNPTGPAAELTQLLPATARATIQDAAGNNIDSDAHDRNYRDGNRRMIVLGHTTNLAADTSYNYRQHCGGDIALGIFRTKQTLAGTANQTVARSARTTGVTNMVVEYGTAFSRATNTISGGGTSSAASCTIGQRCVATFSATRGTILYYRWKERNSGNTVIATGKVELMPAL